MKFIKKQDPIDVFLFDGTYESFEQFIKFFKIDELTQEQNIKIYEITLNYGTPPIRIKFNNNKICLDFGYNFTEIEKDTYVFLTSDDLTQEIQFEWSNKHIFNKYYTQVD